MGFTPYSRAALDTEMLKAANLMVELQAIDVTLQYIAEHFDNWFLGINLGELALHPKERVITLGTTHPFERRLVVDEDPMSPLDDDSNDAKLQAVFDTHASARSTAVEDANSWLVESYQAMARHLAMTPGDYANAHLQVANAHEDLTPRAVGGDAGGDDDFAYLAGELGDWEGPAAREFKEYYTDLTVLRQNHAAVAVSSAEFINGACAVNDIGQQSLMNLACALTEGLDAQLQNRQAKAEFDDTQQTKQLLALSSSATGIIGALTFAAPPVSAGFGVISALLSYAGGQVPAASSTYLNLAVSTAPETRKNYATQVDVIKENVASQMDGLEAEVDRVTHAIGLAKRQQSPSWEIESPLTGEVDPSTFYHTG